MYTQEQLKKAYQTLELPFGASPEETLKKFKKLAILNHPDRIGDRGHEKMQELNGAKEIFEEHFRWSQRVPVSGSDGLIKIETAYYFENPYVFVARINSELFGIIKEAFHQNKYRAGTVISDLFDQDGMEEAFYLKNSDGDTPLHYAIQFLRTQSSAVFFAGLI